MIDFIVAPLVVWICASCIYNLFELFVRRKERMYLIEKFGAPLDTPIFNGKMNLPNFAKISFSGLKFGCLLIGLGLGLITGLMISTALISDGYNFNDWIGRQLLSTAYTAPILIFGGTGLLVSFLIENRIIGKKQQETN